MLPRSVPNGSAPEMGLARPVASATPLLAVSSLCCTTCQLTPSSRLAERDASTKRTSSITCCGELTRTELMTSAPNCLATVIALSTVTASGELPDSMMRPLTEETRKRACGKRCASSLPSRVVS